MDWAREYVLLALRMEKLFPGLIDGYFGPAALREQVDGEAAPAPADVLKAVAALADALPTQGFEPGRQVYLAKQVRALETIARKLNGESFALTDEVQRCFDISPEWTPEAQFEEALALYEQALPGAGSLADRFHAHRSRYELRPDQAHLVQGIMEQIMAEVRQRTLGFIDLPEGEGVEICTVTQQPWGAYNWYLGGYRSRIELNVDLPISLSGLVDMMAHEGYPGHHAEHLLKERLLYRDRGYLEHSILLINTPECVISEGIATTAVEMLFAPGEAERWLAEHIYPLAGISPDGADLAKVNRASGLMAGARGNAAFMLHEEGRPEDEVVQYLMKYTLVPEERARKSLQFIKSPLWRAYIFTYFYGKRLTHPLVQGSDRLATFRRLLTEQVYPSLLVEWAARS